MATQTELDILLTTTADLTGVQQLQQASQQAQAAGQRVQQSMSATVQAANAAMRQAMAAPGANTAQTFQQLSQQIEKAVGARPTLKPEDFGISSAVTQQVTAAARATSEAGDQVRTSLGRATAATVEHTEAQSKVRESFSLTANEAVRFGGSLLGIGAGFSIASTAGSLVKDALVSITQQAIATDQATRSLVATFGAAAANWQQYADVASRGSGFPTEDIESATQALRPLAEQLHLSDTQLRGLLDSAQALSNIHNIPLTESVTALAGALQGSSAAADQLGLHMSDQLVAQRAANGLYQQNFSSLTDLQKAQVRYVELLRQIDTEQKNAAASGPSVTARMRELNTQIGNLNSTIGQGPLAGLVELLTRLNGAIGLTSGGARQAIDATTGSLLPATTAIKDFHTEVDKLPGAVPLQLTGPTPQIEGPQIFGGPLGPDVVNRAQQQIGTIRSSMTQLATATDTQLSILGTRQAQSLGLLAYAAQAAVQSTEDVTNAITVAIQRTQDPTEQSRLQRLLQLIGALQGPSQSLLQAQRTQNQLQQEGVQLAGQQAAIQLQYLPVQQKMAQQERELNRIKLEGQQAALGPRQALEDLQYLEQRNRLIAQDRNLSPAERVAARRDLRAELRQQPGVERAALEAGRLTTPVDRALQQLGIDSSKVQNAEDTAMAAVQAASQQNQLLQTIGAALVAGRQQQVDVIISGAIDVNANGTGQLTDATKQGIVDDATAQFRAQFHASLDDADRGRSQRLLGAG